MTRPSLRPSGFSLVELAIVLFIVSLLIGGMLMPLSAQIEIHGRTETEKSLATIREALIGFTVVNGRLPCPADRAVANSTANAGVEAVAALGGPCGCTTANSGIASAGGTACNDTTPGSVTGVLPWATMGLPEVDAWGNRYTYRVTTRFGRLASAQTDFGACTPATNPTTAAFALCSAGDMSVKTSAAGGAIWVATTVPAIVLSHGKNTFGAYRQDGTLIAGVTVGSDEAENANGDAIFVSNSSIDDQLMWIPGSVLMARMLAAGKLP